MRHELDLERRSSEWQTAKIIEKLTSIESLINSTVDNLANTDKVEANKQLIADLSNIINETLKTKLLPFYQGMADIKRNVKKDVAAMSDTVETCKLNNNEVNITMTELITVVSSMHKWMTSDPESCKILQLMTNFESTRLEEFNSTYVEILEDSTDKSKPASCKELKKKGRHASGVYEIFSPNVTSGVRVYCDQETDGGGWTVIQRRIDGSVDVWRNWDHYKKGFGDLEGEFWIGNDVLSRLTQGNGVFELRVDMKDFDDVSKYAVYNDFKVHPESKQFKLQIGSYNGDAGDSLRSRHKNMKFTTRDVDNDKHPSRNCAEVFKGGWWYAACHDVNLNGEYQRGKVPTLDGVSWEGFRGNDYSLKHVEMKFRER